MPLAPGDVLETEHARLVVGDADDAEVLVDLPQGFVAAYAPKLAGVAARKRVVVEPLSGNAFRLVHESDRAQAALVSIAAARRLESGPQSERVFVFLRGKGLVFFENGDTLPFASGDAVVLPAGEAVRVWAQGPDDVLAVVLQPRMAEAPRRTLAAEIAKRRQEGA